MKPKNPGKPRNPGQQYGKRKNPGKPRNPGQQYGKPRNPGGNRGNRGGTVWETIGDDLEDDPNPDTNPEFLDDEGINLDQLFFLRITPQRGYASATLNSYIVAYSWLSQTTTGTRTPVP